MIKEYFANYFMHQSDITIDLRHHNTEIHDSKAEPWRVTLVDTGHNTQTGGRIKRIQKYIRKDKFLLTYGDGLADVDLNALIRFHNQHGKYATITAVQPPGRFGSLDIDQDNWVLRFREKPKGDGGWINGGFSCLSLRPLIILREMILYGKLNLLKNLQKTVNLLPSSTMVFGTLWIP